MSTVDPRARRADTSITPQRWYIRQRPANRRLRHAEEERQLFITSVVTRSEVLGRAVPDDVDGWSAAASLAWLQEHRNDRVGRGTSPSSGGRVARDAPRDPPPHGASSAPRR